MDYQCATQARIRPADAIREVRRHGIDAVYAPSIHAIVTLDNGRVARIGHDGLVSGRAILSWLGY